jgi:hypothetical protein
MSPQALYLLKAGASYPLIEAARIAIGWPDELMVPQRCMGFPTVGDYPDSGVFRTIERPATRAYPSLASATHNRHMVRFLRNQWRTASPVQRKALRIVTSKTHDEVAAGLCFGGFSIGEMSNILCGDADDPSCFHAMHRFGVIQGVESDGGAPEAAGCGGELEELALPKEVLRGPRGHAAVEKLLGLCEKFGHPRWFRAEDDDALGESGEIGDNPEECVDWARRDVLRPVCQRNAKPLVKAAENKFAGRRGPSRLRAVVVIKVRAAGHAEAAARNGSD